MGRETSGAQSGLEVQAVFEPNRLEKEFITDAYEQVVPTVRRAISRGCEDGEFTVEAGARCAGGAGA